MKTFFERLVLSMLKLKFKEKGRGGLQGVDSMLHFFNRITYRLCRQNLINIEINELSFITALLAYFI